MSALEIIRLIANEFSGISDTVIEQWIEITRPYVSKKQFGKLYEQGLAYLVCHKMKMSNLGENPLGELGKIGVGFGLGSVSEGGSSISFGAGQSSNLSEDAELGLTSYGLQYLSLRRSVIVPIRCASEFDYLSDGECSGGSTSSMSYNSLTDKPKINDNVLYGNKSQDEILDAATNDAIDDLFD